MKPLISIIGRPNVGKSSLFNRLVRRRSAIVHDKPGVTRDRKIADAVIGSYGVTLVDTGGLLEGDSDTFAKGIRGQVASAVEESALIIFLCDGRDGVMPQDRNITAMLRSQQRPVILVVNKMDTEALSTESTPSFYELGLGDPIPISAEHNLGMDTLKEQLEERLRALGCEEETEAVTLDRKLSIRVAVVGRPNVGKSTTVNRLLGEERMLVSEVPGTTRDAVDSRMERNGRSYVLIDTAGIRRRRSIEDDVEKICVVMAMDAIGRCDVALVILDATSPVADQDARIAGLAVEKGRAVVILANKWDLALKNKIWKDEETYVSEIRYRLKFLAYSPVICLSGKTGYGIEDVIPAVDRAYFEYTRRIATSDLNRVMEALQEEAPPPLYKGRRVKFYYAAQTGERPPKFAVVTNRPEGVHFSYRRRVVNTIRQAFGFTAIPIEVEFKERKRKKA